MMTHCACWQRQEQLRQKLIDEPLLEHQEQYKEDPVQPMTREDAETLSRVLNASLPLGSIQVSTILSVTCTLDFPPFQGLHPAQVFSDLVEVLVSSVDASILFVTMLPSCLYS